MKTPLITKTYPGTAVTAGEPFKRNINHPNLRAPEGAAPMVPVPPPFREESYPELRMTKAKRAPPPGERETSTPRFTAQQIQAAHQILQYGNSWAMQASIQVQSTIEKAGVNDAVMLQFLQDKETDPGINTQMKTFESPKETPKGAETSNMAEQHHVRKL